MAIEVALFDIGGVLVTEQPRQVVVDWEHRHGMPPGSLEARLTPVWQAGSVGQIDLPEVHRRIAALLGVDVPTAEAFMERV